MKFKQTNLFKTIIMILFLIAYILWLPLTIINYFLVLFIKDKSAKGYFRNTAVNIDKFANREFRTLWNRSLRGADGYPFGNRDETISSALGKNQQMDTLTRTGRALAWVLDVLDKDHCRKSIVHF